MRNNNSGGHNPKNRESGGDSYGPRGSGGGRGGEGGGFQNRRKQGDRSSQQSSQQNQQHQSQSQHQQQQDHKTGSQRERSDYRDRSSHRDDREARDGGPRDRSGHRDRSGQRNYGSSMHPDSSMGRDPGSNLGSVKFTPGLSTRELPPIETKIDPSKKFTGRCRLFVGNLPHDTPAERVKALFEPFGEVGEIFLGPKSSFGFIKMDTRQNAEAARDALDCSMYSGRSIRVRLAAHAAAIRVRNLSTAVTNELLAYAFRYFGEIERAVVVVDDKGKSIGEGIVEYSKKQSALYAIKRCQQDCFMLTASSKPVLVELFDQRDEDEGLPEKSINKNTKEFVDQRDIGPRFADQGSFEHTYALKWKDLYDLERQKRARLDEELQQARTDLENQMEYTKLEHDTMQLRNRLQQLEDDRLKLQRIKEQSMTSTQQQQQQQQQQQDYRQQPGDYRQQPDLLIMQRDNDMLIRQQMVETSSMEQQPTPIRIQGDNLHDLLKSRIENNLASESSQDNQAQSCAPSAQVGPEPDAMMQMNQMNMMQHQMVNQQMASLNPPFIPVQQPMGMAPMGQQQMISPYMNQQQQMNVPISIAGYIPQPITQSENYSAPATRSQSGNFNRQKFNRNQNQNQNNNNIDVVQSSDRPRKKNRYQMG